jgi:hypothetical protein
VLPLPRRTSCGQHEAPFEPRDTGAAKHLALEPFQACDLPLPWAITPGQADSRVDRVVIIPEAFGKPLPSSHGALGGTREPRLQLLGLPLAHEVDEVLGEIDRLGHVRMLGAQLVELLDVVLGALLLMPDHQPGRLTSGEEPLVGLGHRGEGRPRPSLPGRLALRLAQALCVTGDGGLAARIATLLELAIEAQGITAAGVPPFQEIGFVGGEDTVALVTASPALGQGGRAQIATHRSLPNAQVGGDGMPRPPLVVQRPALLMALDPAGSTWGRLLLSGRWRGWNGDGAVRQGHPLTTDRLIDGRERLVMRLEHLFKSFHQILQEVKPVGDLRGRGRSLARPIGIGFGPIASNDLHPWVRLEPLGQGVCLPIGS